MKLIPLLNYVLNLEFDIEEIEGETIHETYFKRVSQYVRLLSQKIELGLFLPCNNKGEILRDPELTMTQGDGYTYYLADDEEFDEYEVAVNSVMFKNVKRVYDQGGNPNSYSLEVNGIQIGYYKAKPNYWIWHYNNVEDLTGFGLELV